MEKEDLLKHYEDLRKVADKIRFSKSINKLHQKLTPTAIDLNRAVVQKNEEIHFGKVWERVILGTENLPQGPALYIVNHSNMSDVSCLYDAIKRPFYILADANQRKELSTNLFNKMIGVIYVKRYLSNREEERKLQDKKIYYLGGTSPYKAKLKMINRLLNGQNVVAFFEGTWGMDEAELVLPTKFGNIEIAVAAKVPIVPVAMEYLYEQDKVIISIEKPLIFDEFCDKIEANEDVRSAIASRKYLLMEKYSRVQYGEYTQKDFDETLIKNFMGYAKLSLDGERKCVRLRDDYEDYYKRQEQYEYLDKLSQEAKKREKTRKLSRYKK